MNFMCVASVLELTRYRYIKKRRTIFCLSSRGIAKRLVRNKQSTPTPCPLSGPLVGEWIYDKHERFL